MIYALLTGMHCVNLIALVSKESSCSIVCNTWRYDGLYKVTKVFDSLGNLTKMSAEGNDQHTFYLVRIVLPETMQGAQYFNRLSLDELCIKINQERLGSTAGFARPEPLPRYDRLDPLANIVSDDEQSRKYLPKAVRRHSDSDCQNMSLPYCNEARDYHEIQIAQLLTNCMQLAPRDQQLHPQAIAVQHAAPPHMKMQHSWEPRSNGVVPSAAHAINGNVDADVSSITSPSFSLQPDVMHQSPVQLQPPPTPQQYSVVNESLLDASRMQLLNPWPVAQSNNESTALVHGSKIPYYNHHLPTGQSTVYATPMLAKSQFSSFGPHVAPAFTNSIAAMPLPLNNQVCASFFQQRPASISLPIDIPNNTDINATVIYGYNTNSGQEKIRKKQTGVKLSKEQAQEKRDEQMRAKQLKKEQAQKKEDMRIQAKFLAKQQRAEREQEKRDMKMIIKMLRADAVKERRQIKKQQRADDVKERRRKKTRVSITLDARKELEAYLTKKQKQLFTGLKKRKNTRLKAGSTATSKKLAPKSGNKTSIKHQRPKPAIEANNARMPQQTKIKAQSQKSAKKSKPPHKSAKNGRIKHPQPRSTKKAPIKQASRVPTKTIWGKLSTLEFSIGATVSVQDFDEENYRATIVECQASGNKYKISWNDRARKIHSGEIWVLSKWVSKYDPCMECGLDKQRDEMLVCDHCEKPCHLHCAGLNGVPRDDWYCGQCL